ncbi:hypothetical protein P3X46_002826 [Hevea brasiliensis]|uniref:Protein kinase domain-containing protein n=1 Tax=Hevea brasiliensis TaxID=3981 RepID=A0ABQ9N6H9_HEVBR|nr:receptor-like protein kinase FERONIA [Hevea brasiliensis]KAJ9187363.1 hypothetical protein P3X46_002826 [Hevea brasiliensis]
MYRTSSMNPWSFSIFTLLYLCAAFESISCASNNSSSSLDKIVLNCGSAGSFSFNGKNWTGDVGSSFLPADYQRSSISVPLTLINGEVPKIPYSTARVSRFNFTYAFPLSPGFKFIRLHFYPASYATLKSITDADFSVVSGRYTLLNNFSPSVMADTLELVYFTKDFVINLWENLLNITFIPSSGAYAFVNGIEIYNFPANFYNYTYNQISVHHEPAFEMLHRVKVGRHDAFSDDLWEWLDDSSYIMGSMSGTVIFTDDEITGEPWNMGDYAAPIYLYDSARTMGSDDAINMSYNLTWTFLVDSGFKYLVRLHLCEISHEVTGVNQRVFTVYINNQTVEDSLDVIALAGAPLVAIYRDYTIVVPEGIGGKQKLWLALHPNPESSPKFENAILNGVEIMKLSDENNNLAPYFEPRFGKRKKIRVSVVLGAVLGCLGGIFVSCLAVYQWTKRNSSCFEVSQLHPISRDHRKSNMPVLRSSSLCREFTLADVRVATKNFSEVLVIGVGGFGKVYKGSIDGGATQVAIKRKSPESHQGLQEFQTEIDLLSTFRHLNLVSLLGFCQENNEFILVYDYMAGGTLRDHLYKRRHPPLSWNQRLKICIGAARGLHYLHTGTKHSIIHRDIKSTNILLDEDLEAKVSDFGLSRLGPTTASSSYVNTDVKGTLGYLDPEYYRSRKLSSKSDVYSFGVVLLEVLCARPVVVEEEEYKVSLAEWALRCHGSGNFGCIIDPLLRGKIAPRSLITFMEITVKCLADRRTQRPSIGDVLHSLELSLHVQESTDATVDLEDHYSHRMYTTVI